MKTYTYFSEVPVIGEILIAATMVCICTATTVCQLCENGDKVVMTIQRNSLSAKLTITGSRKGVIKFCVQNSFIIPSFYNQSNLAEPRCALHNSFFRTASFCSSKAELRCSYKSCLIKSAWEILYSIQFLYYSLFYKQS